MIRLSLNDTRLSVLEEIEKYLTGQIPYHNTIFPKESEIKDILCLWSLIPLPSTNFYLPILATKALSIVCDTGCTERAFSIVGTMRLNSNRNRLDPTTLNCELFQHMGLQYMQRHGEFGMASNQSMPKNPIEFFSWFGKTDDNSNNDDDDELEQWEEARRIANEVAEEVAEEVQSIANDL